VEPAGEGRRGLHAGAGVGERPDHGRRLRADRRLLLGVTDITVPWETLLLSTVLYVVLPLLAGMATRRCSLRAAACRRERFVAAAQALVGLGLIATVVLLFGFQARPSSTSPA
jgi:ACR3 family arsenite efflux pump ArsB